MVKAASAHEPKNGKKRPVPRKHRFGRWRRNRGFGRRLALWIVGVLLVLVGLAGLVLPILPGWLFLAPGLVVLAGVSRRARLLLHRLLNRFPWLDRIFLKVRAAQGKGPAKDALPRPE